ncbi:PREDICTED: uncharacterized protein LOC109191086 [Ipomoea nil]|uniref:uncharacterized protein LOC109163400 n=1 Tax=Ipomoea nil TaxID=35883 RepID=UPI000901C90F|nr:PREDICTED: uncharacterized protein LOC109163400 [Ipomoea nil]XP_019197202.1 PREDICTED: uncharacterized protein LOC109191086 [Ipomoea nil]
MDDNHSYTIPGHTLFVFLITTCTFKISPIIKKFPVTSRGHARYVHPSKRTVNCNNFSSSLTVVTVKAPLVKSSMHVDWDSTVAVLILRKGLVEAFNLQVIRTEANVE